MNSGEIGNPGLWRVTPFSRQCFLASMLMMGTRAMTSVMLKLRVSSSENGDR